MNPFCMDSSFLSMVFEGLHGWGIKPEMKRKQHVRATGGLLSGCLEVFTNPLPPQSNGDPSGCSVCTQCSNIQPVRELMRWTPGRFVAANAWRYPGTWLVVLETRNYVQLDGTETLTLFCPTPLNLQWSLQWEKKSKSNDWDLLCVCVFVLTGSNLDDSELNKSRYPTPHGLVLTYFCL